MKATITSILTVLSLACFVACTHKTVKLTSEHVEVINRQLLASPNASILALDKKLGVGLAIVKDIAFTTGTIELEIKGENKPGQSFVGIAFNVQNDSTYEAIYFRPFNFQSTDKIRREHSIQYISSPKNDWRYLRTNFEGQFEAEYPRQPSPNDWFKVRIKIEHDTVYVYDVASQAELLQVKRLQKELSTKIGLWTGHNSKGAFRNLQVVKN